MKCFVLVFILVSLIQISCSKIEQKEIAGNEVSAEKSQNSQNENTINAETKFGYVPDEKTAIEIAIKIWNPIYGKEKIEQEAPYHATLKNGVWTVWGSLPEDMDGGVAQARISQKDGKILKIIHGK